MSQQQQQKNRINRQDQQMPASADGWAAQLAADRNNYQKGTHQKQYQHDMSMAQSYVDRNFGQVQITGTQDGHLVGLDRQSKNYVSLNNDSKVAIGSPPTANSP